MHSLRHSHTKRGFSLLEMVVYVAILSFVMVVVVNVILALGASWNSLRVSRDINEAALVSLERMGRDIRKALDVDTGASIFASHPGVLVLSGSPEIEFSLEDGSLIIREDGIDLGALTKSTVDVTNLVFRFVSGSTHRGVRIEMTIEGARGKIVKTKNFYLFVTLRAPYQ